MATKFEIEARAEEIKSKRGKVIAELKSGIADCTDLLRVMGKPATAKDEWRRQVVTMRRAHLLELLADEQRAFDAAYFEASNQLDNGKGL